MSPVGVGSAPLGAVCASSKLEAPVTSPRGLHITDRGKNGPKNDTFYVSTIGILVNFRMVFFFFCYTIALAILVNK